MLRLKSVLAWGLLLFAAPSIGAAGSGYAMEAGVFAGAADGPDERSAYMRATTDGGSGVEVLALDKFGGAAGQLSLWLSRDLGERLTLRGGVAASDKGVILPQVQGSLEVARKFLPGKNLVGTVGAGYYSSRDGHRDTAAWAGMAWYTTVGSLPVVLETGLRHTVSNPGAATGLTGFAAATAGQTGRQTVSVRVSGGTEAWTPIGGGAVEFQGREVSASWRLWTSKRQGIALTVRGYDSPAYDVRGVGFSWFREF